MVTVPNVPFETVYFELKRIADWRLRGLAGGRTLHATVLVHEVYLRLVARTRDDRLFSISSAMPSNEKDADLEKQQEHAEFFAACSEAMRCIIIDHYRRRTSLKRGGHFRRLAVELGELPCASGGRELLDVDEALKAFESIYPEKAQLVKLRFFGGMTMVEAAQALDISLATAERHWRFSRAWIANFLKLSVSA